MYILNVKVRIQLNNILCLQLLESVCTVCRSCNYKYVTHKIAVQVHYAGIFSIKAIKLVPRGFSVL